MWDLPGPGIEPVSPALAGRFLTTVPPGKPPYFFDYCSFIVSLKIGKCESSEFALFLKKSIVLAILGLLQFYKNVRISL